MDKKRILVVDDQDTWLKTIQVMLGDQYELSLTNEAEEAIALSRTTLYSLAILDQRLTADVSGLDLLEQLRRIQQDLRFIILTGYADVNDAVSSIQRGALDYLSKGRPNLREELRDRVAKILESPTFEEQLLSILLTQIESEGGKFFRELYVPHCIQLIYGDGHEENLEDAVSTVHDWLMAEGPALIFILGDIGVGKTFFLHQLALELTKDQWGGAALFIRPGLLGNARNIYSLISEQLSDLAADRVDLARISDLYKQGRLILLLDGYDESLPYTAPEQATRQLETLVSSISGNAKAIVTSRTQYFSSDNDLLSYLDGFPDAIAHLRFCKLLPFSEEQASVFLSRRLEKTGPISWRQLTYAFDGSIDLLRNPRMLALLTALDASTLLKLRDKVDYPISIINVLSSLCDDWLRCEDEKRIPRAVMQPVSSEARFALLAAIANRIFRNKLEFLAKEEIVESARMVINSLNLIGIAPENLAHWLCARSFLQRDRAGRLSFIDRIIMEWLVVFTAAKEMRQGLYPESLLAAPISQRIYEMLVRLSGRGACVALANRIVGDPDKFGGHAAELAAKLLQDSSDTDQNEQPFIPQFPWLDWLNNRGDESAISRLAFECFQTPVIRVRALRIRNIRSFEDTGIICFCEGGGATRTVTLIVGDNAAGKSTLLQCLAIAFLGPALANQLNIPIEGLLRHKAKAGFIEVEFEFRDQLSVVDAPSSFFVGIELRAGETGFRSADRRDCMLLNGLREESENSALRLDAVRRLDHGGIGFLCAYGPWRTLNVEPSSSLTQHPNKVLDRVFSLFHSETLVMDPDLLSRIISGQVVTTGTTVPVGLDNEMKRLLCKTICDVVPNLSIAEEQAGRLVLHGVPLALRALSDGYGSLLALIGHVVHHGVEFRSASAPLRLPVGLVLIDEIDLHLHPSWQRRILSDLTRSFPEAQFVVSSHSPMVAGSTPSDGIVLLRREGERIAIRSDIGSVQGWRADQILTSALFDLDSSRDIGTSNLIERYTQLSIADSLSVDEKDELKEIAAQLRIRLPTSAEKAHARQASKIIEATYRMQFDALPVEEKERLVVELRAQLLEAMTQSRRPE